MRTSLLLALALLLPMGSASQVPNSPMNSPSASGGARNAPFVASMLSPDSIPVASIPVLANALGDVVLDGKLNLLDLLRVRNILIGKPPAPTGYERVEADVNADGNVTATDLDLMRDILLRKRGVPYFIDSTGGYVLGDGITLTIPPRAVGGTVVISIRRRGEFEFGSEMGVDTKGAIGDSVYFMSAFEITSSTLDFTLPVGAAIKLDSMPPCAYQGLNGLFSAVPDRDGDGRSELFLINELRVIGDSLTVIAGDIPVPTIASLSLSQVEPGQSLTITGQGFGKDPQSVVLHFQSTASDLLRVTLPSACDSSTIICTVPDVPQGTARVTVRNVFTGLTSNAMPITVNPYGSVIGDIRAAIVGFYTRMAASIDSLDAGDLLSGIEDTTVREYFRGEMLAERALVANEIDYYTLLADSLLEMWRPFAAFIQNIDLAMPIEGAYGAATLSRTAECAACASISKKLRQTSKIIRLESKRYYDLLGECAVGRADTPPLCVYCVLADLARMEILRLTDLEALFVNLLDDCRCRSCGGQDCDECDDVTFVGYGPQGMKVSGGYNPSGGFSTTGCCINIIRYKRNPCIAVPVHFRKDSPVPASPLPGFSCPPASPAARILSTTSEVDTRPHPGSIIRVMNAPVPYNIVGILNDNGHAFIPQVPMNTKVTYSLYDPVTGFYDPDVGTYTTGSTPGGFDRPILLFRPNTQIKSRVLKVGEPAHDSVSLDTPRIDFMITIGAADTSKLFNIGFSASAHLGLKIEDPQGSFLFDNTDVACYAIAHVRFSKVGTYRIRVGFGAAPEPGSFDLGVSYSPSAPLASNCLCGTVWADSLFYELSPYVVRCSATVPANDTLRTEAGVTLQFEAGGTLTATGAITGVGSPERPIKLKHAGAPSPGPATPEKAASGRKEVQP